MTNRVTRQTDRPRYSVCNNRSRLRSTTLRGLTILQYLYNVVNSEDTEAKGIEVAESHCEVADERLRNDAASLAAMAYLQCGLPRSNLDKIETARHAPVESHHLGRRGAAERQLTGVELPRTLVGRRRGRYAARQSVDQSTHRPESNGCHFDDVGPQDFRCGCCPRVQRDRVRQRIARWSHGNRSRRQRQAARKRRG